MMRVAATALTLVVLSAPASADEPLAALPKYDSKAVCDARDVSTVPIGLCYRDEERFKAVLVRFWDRLPPRRREECAAMTDTAKDGYVFLESCLNDDLKAIRGGAAAVQSLF